MVDKQPPGDTSHTSTASPSNSLKKNKDKPASSC